MRIRARAPLVGLLAALCAGLAARVPLALAGLPGSETSAATPRFIDETSLVDRVLALENERLSVMSSVAAWKWRHHVAVYAPARERAVLAAAERLGAPLGLAGAPLERLFELQIRLARMRESELERGWRARGFDFAGRIPDLRREIRPRLDRLTHELIAAIYVAAPAWSRPGFGERGAARAAKILSGAGWSASSRRELIADLASIRLRPVPALERIEASHVLRVGTTGDYAPFSSDTGGRLRGADIDLALDLARALGARPVFVRTSWPTLLADLDKNDFDVAIGGISATRARESAAAVSIPYLSGGKTILARCRDARRFASLAEVDRPGVRVIVNPGGANERYDLAHLRRAKVIVHPDNATIFDQLLAGRADVMITDDFEVALETRLHPRLCRAYPGLLTHAGKVLLMPRDRALVSAVNGWLRRELAAGVPARELREALAR